jgi:hypothetical protein
MALKFRRGTTAQKSGSLAFGEPYVNTTLGTLQIGGPDGDITLGSTGTGSTGTFGAISGSGLDITGNANIAGNLTLGGQLTIGDNTSDTVNVVASLSSSLIPETSNTYNLGSATKFWKEIYVSTGSIKFVDNAGNVVSTLSSNASGDFNIDGEFSASSITGIGNVATYSSSVASRLIVAESFSASANAGITSLNLYTSSLKGALSISGADLTVLGNLTVQGDTTTINTANLLVEDHIVEIAIGATTSLEANGAGLRVPAADAIIKWNHTGSAWTSNKSFDVVGDITLSGTVDGVDIATLNSNVNSLTSSVNSFTSSIDTTIKNKLDTEGVISGSSQVALSSTTGFSTYSTSVDSRIVTNSNSAAGAFASASAYSASAATTYAQLAVANTFTGNQIINGTLTLSSSAAVELTVIGNQVITGSLTATGDVVAFSTSDRRHKNNIVLISDALSKVTKLNGVTWEWNDDVDAATKETPKTGLIAQEVQEVLPEVVKERADGFLALDYSKTIGLLVEAIKEQQTQIHSLTLEIEKLKKNNSL